MEEFHSFLPSVRGRDAYFLKVTAVGGANCCLERTLLLYTNRAAATQWLDRFMIA